jgi:hypothetical protein
MLAGECRSVAAALHRLALARPGGNSAVLVGAARGLWRAIECLEPAGKRAPEPPARKFRPL